MKIRSLLLIFAAMPYFYSCSNDLDEQIAEIPQQQINPNEFNPDLFPVPDKARRASYDPAEALNQIMKKFDQTKSLVMGETQITDEQFEEIKKFVSENLKGETDLDTYNKIFEWIHANLHYAQPNEEAYVDPYEVFIHKVCVCQGYANLMKTMCITQGIPAMTVNGMLIPWGGHAWNYVYAGGEWQVADPTNNTRYLMKQVNNYKKSLAPYRTDLNLFEDENFCYDFSDSNVNISEVKNNGKNYITVPYSVAGYLVTQFCPHKPVASNFTQLYLGKNIETLGQNPSLVNQYFPSLEEIYIDETNRKLETYKNIVYRKKQTTPYFIPSSIRRVELKPMKAIEKNTLYNLSNVEEIVVADGTERLESYCIERCPNLKTVSVPESVTYIAEDAIYQCNDNVQIVRRTTGIVEVTK